MNRRNFVKGLFGAALISQLPILPTPKSIIIPDQESWMADNEVRDYSVEDGILEIKKYYRKKDNEVGCLQCSVQLESEYLEYTALELAENEYAMASYIKPANSLIDERFNMIKDINRKVI